MSSRSGPRRQLVLEADGGSRGNPGPAAYGTLIRDAGSGEVLVEEARTLGVVTNNVAEYRGLIAGLRLVQVLDPEAAVEVRMDSKLVIEQMAGRWRIKNADLQPLAAEARSSLPAGQVRWTWVPREQNRRADELANAAMDGKVEDVIEHPLHGDPLPIAAVPGSVPASATGPATASAGHAHQAAVFAADPAPESGATTAATPQGETGGRRVVPATTTTVLLLRHGRTSDNVARRFSGPRGTDPGLDETGRSQAHAVARAVTVFDAVFASPLRRTMQTARVLAEEAGLDVTEVSDLREYESGDWDGLTEAEASESEPGRFGMWLVSPDVAPPNGESMRAVARRVRTALERIVETHRGGTVLIVSHAVPIACVLLETLEAPLASGPRLAIRNASLTRIRYPLEGPPEADTIGLPAGVPLPD